MSSSFPGGCARFWPLVRCWGFRGLAAAAGFGGFASSLHAQPYPHAISAFQIFGDSSGLPYILPMPLPGYNSQPACDPLDLACHINFYNAQIVLGYPTILGVHQSCAPISHPAVVYPNVVEQMVNGVRSGSFSYVIADIELDGAYPCFHGASTDSLTAITNMVKLVGQSELHSEAYVGAYGLTSGDKDASWTQDHYDATECRHQQYLDTGLRMAMPICYPYEGHALHWICGGDQLNEQEGATPTYRSAMFYGPLESFSSAARSLPAGHVVMPWTARFVDENGPYEPPPQADTRALHQHLRLRGAHGYMTFCGVCEPSFEKFRQDMLDAWQELDFIGASPEVVTLAIHKKLGVVVSGAFNNDTFTFLISNLRDDQPVWVNLPDFAGVPDGLLVSAETHVLQTYPYTGSENPRLPLVEWSITRPGDVNWDGAVDLDDYLMVINDWGDCDIQNCDPCRGDLTGNGTVNVDDQLEVINNWD